MYDFNKVYDRRGTGCFKSDGLEMLFGKADLLPLWVADMDFAVAPEILEDMQERLKHPIFGYNLRLPPYYEAIINWIGSHYHWQVKKDWIVSTPGIVTAINIAVATLTAPGEGIVVQTPVYDPFFHAVNENKRRLLTNPLLMKNGSYEIDFADLEQKLAQSKMFILCSPHNPVGRVWTETELLQMGRLCRKHKVIVVADEIHADIVYSGSKHTAFANLEDFADFTVACYSPSKSFNLAGLCTSAIIIPSESLREPFNDYVQSLHLFLGNTFGITALQSAYTKGQTWLQELLIYLEGNRNYLHDFIHDKLPNLQMINPEGTFLAWLDFRSLGLSDTELQELMINKSRLALSTGITYGSEGSGFLRLNFGCPRLVLEKACERLLGTFK